MMMVARERRNAVDRIWNDAAALGKLRHQHPVRIRRRAELLFELGHRLRMGHERNAERRGSRLARVIVGCRSDAAETEYGVAASEAFGERRGEPAPVIAFVACPREPPALRGERLDHVHEMRIAPLARQDLVADDERAEVHRTLAFEARMR